MKKMTFRKILNVLLPLVIVYEWCLMFLFGQGVLSSRGIASFKYFTILSNLLEAFACVVWLFKKNETLKYVACVSVMLTFTVVLAFLGPLFGYVFMFSGPNLWFHGLVPLISLAELLFMHKGSYSGKENLLAALPMGIYGVLYIGNNLINGIGEWPSSNDWYGFLTWGYPVGFCIYFIILFVTYLIGFVLRKIKSR